MKKNKTAPNKTSQVKTSKSVPSKSILDQNVFTVDASSSHMFIGLASLLLCTGYLVTIFYSTDPVVKTNNAWYLVLGLITGSIFIFNCLKTKKK